jgi:hypothetical protein
VASRGGLSGLALAEIAAGVILAWSGIENASVASSLRSLLGGKKPAPDTGNEPVTAPPASGGSPQYVGGNPPSTATIAGYKAYAQTLLAAHGWPLQMPSFNSIVVAESNWNSRARNASSGAFGIGQALGHGQGAATAAADGTNEYGNYGTSDAVCKAANGGSGTAQIEWTLNYIGAAYGSPDAAWAHHQDAGTY